MGQVARVAESIGLDLEVFLGLSRAALADVERVGPAAALTGPAARGDTATLARHRAALAPEERAGYDACVALAQRLVEEGLEEGAGLPVEAGVPVEAGLPVEAGVPVEVA
jgi:predicted short-subunit dehydrogenase-like oxidoreductase (DUF2520 family)